MVQRPGPHVDEGPGPAPLAGRADHEHAGLGQRTVRVGAYTVGHLIDGGYISPWIRALANFSLAVYVATTLIGLQLNMKDHGIRKFSHFSAGHEGLLEAEDGDEQGDVVLDLADGGGDLGAAGLADEPDGEVTQGCHDAGTGSGPDSGRILTERDIADPVDWASHCSFTARGWLEQPVLGGR